MRATEAAPPPVGVHLPFVDEHARVVPASADRVWAALVHVLPRAFGGAGAERYARLVGCDPWRPGGAFPAEGSAVVGFHVARADVGRELALVGKHRFSEYALVFRLDALDDGRATRVRAETRAAFPGLLGRAYRLAVIGTRGHVLLLRRMLRGVERKATSPR